MLGAQTLFGIEPDITTLGKIIGGGLPVGAYGARTEIMDRVAPAGDVYQAGTLSGNPLAVKAGIATLRYLNEHDPYTYIGDLMNRLVAGISDMLSRAGQEFRINHLGSMMTLFFTGQRVVDCSSALISNRETYAALFHLLLDAGIYTPPSPFECWFMSVAHTDEDIESTLAGFLGAIGKL